jgi:Flp pilus assembly protein TadD
MNRLTRLPLAALIAVSTCGASPRPHVDPDAIREVRRAQPGPRASSRAIAAYLEARRRLAAGDAAGEAEALGLAVTWDESSPELRVSLADALHRCGRVEAAEGEARRALELAGGGPAASEARILLARLAREQRRLEVAILELRQAVRIEAGLAASGARPDPRAWQLLAATYLEVGDETAAWRTLEDLSGKVPGDADGFREAGRFLLDRRDPGRAERHLRRAVEVDPSDARAWRLLASAHEALGRPVEARDDLLALLRLDPDDGPALLALGRDALGAGDPDRARELFQRHLRAARPRSGEAAVQVVTAWLEAGRAADGLQVARGALAETGPEPRLRYAEGLALRDLRRFAEAAQALQAVGPEVDAFFVPARLALADVLSRAGRHAEAERALAEPLRDHPSDVRLLTTRAVVLERAGRAGEAAQLLDRAAADRERAGDTVGSVGLSAAHGETLARAGRASYAALALERALMAHPRSTALLLALARAYDAAGRTDQASAQLRALLVLEPEHGDALSLLGRVLADRGQRLDEAERLVRRGAELRPRSPAALDAVGRVLLARGDAAGAVAALERAEALGGTAAEILLHLGEAYRAAARPADAASAWRRGLSVAGDELPGPAARLRAALERRLAEAGPERPIAREHPAPTSLRLP